MANISAAMVKDLREKTGAGMLDCKKALDETNGDIEKAIDYLREKGISKAAKKQSRVAAEGVSKIKIDGNNAAVIEVNSETDFVAKNQEFKDFVDYLLDVILNNDVESVEDVLDIEDNGETVNDKLVALTSKIGEKISFRRFRKVVKSNSQIFGTYEHNNGAISSLVIIDGDNNEVAHDIALQAATMAPIAVNRDSVDSEVVEHEKAVIKEQIKNDEKNKGKSDDIIDKMAVGKLNKFFKENCLDEQEFVKDSDLTVGQYAKNNKCSIVDMIRFQTGEGIEKRQENFAEEVAKQMQSA